MYNILHLLKVARLGLEDMAPALRRAFNRSRDDDRLDRVFGPRPKLVIGVLIGLGLVLGTIIEKSSRFSLFTDHVNVSALLIGAAYALLFRRYLFDSGEARRHDFPWLAASLIPAGAALVLASFLGLLVSGRLETIAGAPGWTAIGGLLHALAESLGVAAGLTIAVAALCFSENWLKAVKDLAVQLLLFKLVVFIMVLLMIEIGIVGPILGALLRGLFGLNIPFWLGDLADQLSWSVMMSIIYISIVGATWMVCRDTFGQLLKTGDAEILTAIKRMAETPGQAARRERKQARAATAGGKEKPD